MTIEIVRTTRELNQLGGMSARDGRDVDDASSRRLAIKVIIAQNELLEILTAATSRTPCRTPSHSYEDTL